MANASNWMVSRKELAAQFPLDTQSRGRELTKPEQDFAVALESVFAQGIHDMENVAGALTKAGVTASGSGGTQWDIETLASELTAINASLDEAFEENGYRAALELRHWHVLEQDRVMLSEMTPDAGKRDMLYQHDLGVSRIRQVLLKAAGEQIDAETAMAAG